MPLGTLEVLLIGAKGLKDTEFIFNMDPYAILTYRDQEKKSSVAKGTSPEWNETFLFSISDGVSELKIKIMDKDKFTKDDFIGEATIPLDPVLYGGDIPPTSYHVMRDENYHGEIKLALKFFRQIT